MPLYDFVCPDCNQEQEHLVRGAETPTCESCGGVRLVKLVSAPVAHIAGQAGSRPQSPPGSCGSGCGCHPH
jgi:putative FmdB family regulatory protein